MILKIAYTLSREMTLFNLPLFRRLRNIAYGRYLQCLGINVDKQVKIQPLHRNAQSRIQVGKDLHIGAHATVDCSGQLVLGDRVTISEGAKIFTHDHPIDDGPLDWRKNPVQFRSLTIHNDVWIGANAIILSSVGEIGEGAVVAANAVVTRPVEPLSVVAGVPAKHIRYRSIHE